MVEGGGILCVVVKCVEMWRNIDGEGIVTGKQIGRAHV